MDVRQLRHFEAVAETLHFGRAAERLHITQPPLSQSILALERELGAALFVRTKRRVALTDFGTQWLTHVRQALAGVDALAETARRLRDGESGQLNLSFVSTADYNLLPAFVRRFAARFPKVEMRLTEATSDVQIPAIEKGEIHAGIIIPPPAMALPPGLRYQRLITEPLIAAVPEQWISRGRLKPVRNKLSPRTLVGQPLILFPRDIAPAFHDLVTGYFTAQGAPAVIVQQAIQMQTIVSLVSAGLGIALVPASLRKLVRAGVQYLDLAGVPPMLETGIAWKESSDSAVLRNVLQVFGEVAGREPC
jgi:DNA-binding transcriptional LysR family regulator